MKRLEVLGPTALLAAAVMSTACAGSKRAAIPPLYPSPGEAGVVAIYVDPKLDVTGYWSRSTLGRQLARALRVELEGALVRAGYDVGRPDPELIARISTSISGSTSDLATTTVVEVSHQGKIVDRFELITPAEDGALSAELYPEYAAVKLTNRISASGPIHALELAVRTGTTTRQVERRAVGSSVVAAFDIEDSAAELDGEAKGQLSEYVAARTAQVMGFRLVPRAELRGRLATQKAETYRACFDQSCQIELGKALAAQKTLATKLIRVGETCALIATVFDLETETAELSASVKTRCGRSSLLEGLDELIGELHRQQLLGPSGRGRVPRGRTT